MSFALPDGVARGDCRQHVQRQERRAHPPDSPRPDRQTARADFQARRRHPLRRRPHRVAQRLRIPSEPARTAAELLAKVQPDTEVVGIDEGQFFDAELPVCARLAARGVRSDRGRPRPGLPRQTVRADAHLLAVAEYITKTRAICMVCGNPANHTQRLVQSTDRVLLGAMGTYEARCRHCFDPSLATAVPAGATTTEQS